MKPNYDMFEHYMYLNRIRLKWVEQLQELIFIKKESIPEGRYLFYMDQLKSNHDIGKSVLDCYTGGHTDWTRVRQLINNGRFNDALDNVENELGYMEDIKKCLKVYEMMKKGDSGYLHCAKDQLLAYLNEEYRHYSMKDTYKVRN